MANATEQTLGEKYETWLAEQKVSAQTPEFKPKNIFTGFPRKDIATTGQVLVDRLWWWRRANKETCHEIFGGKEGTEDAINKLQTYEDYHQLSAYLYEFHARMDGWAWALGRPWILCSQEQREFLRQLWPMKTTPRIWHPSEQAKKSWVEMPARKINLAANDNALVKPFLEAVNRLRQQHGIKRPGDGAGVRRKAVSFLPIELLDKAHYLTTKLNDSQRSQVSKAKRNWRKVVKESGLVS